MATGPNDRNDWTPRDRWNAKVVQFFTPIIATSLSLLLALVVFVVQLQFSWARDETRKVSEKAELASNQAAEVEKRAAVLGEAVSTMKGDIKEIKEGQGKTNDKLDRLLIEMQQQRRPR